MKKILMLVLPIVLLTACVDTLDDWNIDQKRASNTPARTLFTSASKNFTDILTTPNVNSNNYRMFVQYWATTTYLDEPRYNMTARLYSENFWNAMYRDVIADLRECKRLIEVQTDASTVPAVKANQLALCEIMEIYAWYTLVNTFGDVPYTEAMVASNSLPTYDQASDIYADLLTRLDAALTSMTPASGSFTGGADVFYAGSVPKWVKFGNSLKLKMGILLADVDNTKAKSTVESAVAAGVITLAADNAKFPYMAAAPNNNPIATNLNPSFTSREDFVVAATLVDTMNTLNDPRRQFYFTQVGSAYIGGKYGFSNAYANFSHPSAKIIAPTFEALIMDNVEVLFLLAEAAERGYTVGGSAQSFYDAGITASIAYWGGTGADATTYLAQTGVAYATATGTNLYKIGRQKWIAMNNRGWDAWVDWRRLDSPALLPPGGPTIPNPLFIPMRMVFPISEQTVNTAAWETAAARYGTDSPNSKIFWDVN
jgi:hypothetical protein